MKQIHLILIAIGAIAAACPEGWLSFNDRCFYPNYNNQTFPDAVRYCASLNVTEEYTIPGVFAGDEVDENEYILSYFNMTESWVDTIAADPTQCFELNDALQPARPSTCSRFRLSICSTMLLVNSTAQEWDYNPCEHGPAEWGNLGYPLCVEGKRQSPIDIFSFSTSPIPERYTNLTINYGSDNGKIFYNNETCQVAINSQKMYISGGPLGEERYYLTQFHTHEVSEHHIDGMAYPLELHLVHTSLTGKIAVLALFFRVGPQNNSFVESFVTHCHLRKPLGANLNLTSLLDQYLLKYYTYTGSLTTPPCTEGVRWILLKKEYFITRKQLSMFLQVLPHHGANNRPIQRAYGRAVFSN